MVLKDLQLLAKSRARVGGSSGSSSSLGQFDTSSLLRTESWEMLKGNLVNWLSHKIKYSSDDRVPISTGRVIPSCKLQSPNSFKEVKLDKEGKT